MTEKLATLVDKSQVFEKEQLKNHTTFKVGGPCKALVVVTDEEELLKVIKYLEEEKIPYFILGNGSNLLVSDEGFDGVVVKLEGKFLNVTCEGDKVFAGAGAVLGKVASFAKEQELTGLEFAHGIPGTVGGAMVMNAGAYDGEMKLVVESVKLLKGSKIVTYDNASMKFGYRDSIMKHEKLIALETTFVLKKGDKQAILDKMADFSERRRNKQPLEFPSAGSTFKRPEGYFAGKLIEDTGLKGRRIGGASVSTKHSGFIINDLGGSAKDINDLIEVVIDEVKSATGVTLEPEVIRIGKF